MLALALADGADVHDEHRVGVEPVLAAARALIVPGVGHFRDTLIFAQVGGRWQLNAGGALATLALTQRFQQVSGSIQANGRSVRAATIFWTVTGPMPGKRINSSADASRPGLNSSPVDIPSAPDCIASGSSARWISAASCSSRSIVDADSWFEVKPLFAPVANWLREADHPCAGSGTQARGRPFSR